MLEKFYEDIWPIIKLIILAIVILAAIILMLFWDDFNADSAKHRFVRQVEFAFLEEGIYDVNVVLEEGNDGRRSIYYATVYAKCDFDYEAYTYCDMEEEIWLACNNYYNLVKDAWCTPKYIYVKYVINGTPYCLEDGILYVDTDEAAYAAA